MVSRRSGMGNLKEKGIFQKCSQAVYHTATVVLSPGHSHILQLQPVFLYNIDSHKCCSNSCSHGNFISMQLPIFSMVQDE